MVETARLTVFPLNEPQLNLYLEAGNKFEKEMQLTCTGRGVSPDVKKIVSTIILPKIKFSLKDHYLFFTFWIVVERASQTIVAELGFKGPPGRKGDIEIGYGTMPGNEGKGYMTEAVSGMIEWAKSRADVLYILAETDEHNAASIRVVEKNGFESLKRKGRMLWWKKEVNRDLKD